MRKIEKILLELRDAVIEEVDFHFEKALRESKTFGDLLLYRPDELELNNSLSNEINREIGRRYRTKVQMFINKKSLDK
ncbi:hypothetical protein MTW76_01530 [Mammaliicoccus sciuri]|uniref:hypothetical protein n=1 Tax=Mammaliicoccus sciuri TaxID=1296 RepID=UPI001FB287F5|nr:hypothetical protein [Mammaliicoccus sciuri]MCJ0933652.1 hypothetical protein [Mammaliicoccus sciuri]MDO0950229.1 hypothetical protein [Mammaliicoccus sciuri]